MDLDVVALDEAREAWRAGSKEDVRAVAVASMTLGATLESACWAATGDEDVRAMVERWGASHPALRAAVMALTTANTLPRSADHDAPNLELHRCPSRAELADPEVGVEWRYFLDRFRRSLTTTLGLSAMRARGLAAGLHEMVDNVVEHAGLGDTPVGVVVYEVSSTRFGFAVTDLGRGVLASLRENPAHSALRSHSQALLAAVTHGASRRPGEKGKGFADLLRALTDLEGIVSFRSGSARLRLDGRGVGNRRIIPSNSPEMIGFQLSVAATPKKSAW